jgi:alanyl-tRNA synthetase
MTIDANKLRQDFLRFFEGKGCKPLPSSSLVPPDASTLFTSAGMHQFKDDFMGNLQHGTREAATVQKCMRTPDLENVGRTARHHTFFEMLGFFSFGSFFKREAIEWIWEFYTSKDWCGLNTKKLYISVYGGDDDGAGRDEEAADIWREVLGRIWDKDEVERRIYWLGEHDNFWPAGAPSKGPNGVCGPCSEIFYDLGDEYGEGNVETNGDRYMEIGNIVFTQFERSGPAPGKGELTPLPAKNIDFGGGFERLVMVLEDAKTTLDTSLFTSIRNELRYLRHESATSGSVIRPNEYACLIECWYALRGANDPVWQRLQDHPEGMFGDPQEVARAALDLNSQRFNSYVAAAVKDIDVLLHQMPPMTIRHPMGNATLRTILHPFQPDWAEKDLQQAKVREKRIADHIRAVAFSIADGILPSNEGAGYVIRRIIRRAFRDGTALGFDGPFLHKLVPVIVDQYGDAYPELKANPKGVAATIQQEEQQFSTTLERGLQQLAGLVRGLKDSGEKTLKGKPAFDLYQSQGLPREVVQDELAAVDLNLDLIGYEEAEKTHREASKGGKQAEVFEKGWFQEVKARAKPTEFKGYETCEAEAKVVAIVRDGQMFDIVEKADSAIIVLDRSPFYAESGGQVGDRGSLHVGEGVFEVSDTQKRDEIWLHEGKVLHGKLRVGDTVTARVDQARRDKIRANHSATHLLHAALKQVLGEHVVQRGSEVGPDRLRFDFSHPKALTWEEREQIEQIVNRQVQANTEVGIAEMSPNEAQQAGAVALFGEKYGDKVRVLSMGSENYSMELCGGTHVVRTGDIGYFRIVSEGSSAAGIRRIEAITGESALGLATEESRLLAELHSLTKAQPGKLAEKVKGLIKEVKDLKGKSKKGGGVAPGALEAVRAKGEKVGDVTVYVAEVLGAEQGDMLTIRDALGQDAGPTAILLGSRSDGRALLLLTFSKDLVGRGLHAGKLIGEIARLVGGGGGGKPDTAQAGGKKPESLAEALKLGRAKITELLQAGAAS